jgi:hypothetical protein
MSNSESVTSPEGMSKAGRLSGVRTGIYVVLTLAGLGLLLYSWYQPWWTAYIEALKLNAVTVFPTAMRINLGDFPQWLVGAGMPAWFFPAMWAYLGIVVGVLVFSLFLGDEDRVSLGKSGMPLQKVLVGAVGVSYLLIVAACAIVISIRAPQFYGASLQGTIFISKADYAESYVTTSLQLGYWLACAAGAYLVVLALLRGIITGKR